ncbi:hypothetical protein I4U23_011390 [Adineta vaga]|nr:hypothetical protein I4U23_011390 [Adineta vaga]
MVTISAENDTNTCGINYMTNIYPNNEKLNLTLLQKISVEYGDSNKWDLSTLTNILIYSTRPITLTPDDIQ